MNILGAREVMAMGCVHENTITHSNYFEEFLHAFRFYCGKKKLF